ncbi:MAG: cryptochrome/photolyase family protein [Rickettsiales bacterium]|nr:cryptochrome/photolyase family protein [Rickettsiales bacterium]
MSTLRLILGDQLSHSISSLADCNKEVDLILMCEVWEEATYVKHHKKKIAFLFSAMRHFAQELTEKGYSVIYRKLDCDDNQGSFFGEVQHAVKAHAITKVIVTKPGEYRLLHDMQDWQHRLEIPVELREDDRYLCSTEEFAKWAKGRKQLRMEFFYREMRKKHNILMQVDKPVGGKWNYDAENRKPPKQGLDIPAAYTAQKDTTTQEVIDLVAQRFDDHFGDLEPFYFAVTREQALYCLRKFIDERLSHFGTYQDAMIQGEPWMYHSHLSFYINCGLLDPMECIKAAEQSYYDDNAPLNAVEGFIRQILGWREYVRGIYWLNMPEYADANALEASRDLPWFYWTGETKMNCLRQCIIETKENAYAHHIQRLMVLGNFALIAGIDPKQVNEWYLIVYADAYEWVEMPNVTGMILFADGGFLASKPYASSGSYINKMSNYCEQCSYKVTQKNGEKACPFNYLYWDFLDKHRERFASNHRMAMMYKTYDRLGDERKQAIRQDSERFLQALKHAT